MADVFISYASTERTRTGALAAALEAAGYTVWWDKRLLAGDEFSREIEQQIAAASVVLVLWTRASVDSKWVRSEAGRADRLGKLITARARDLDINDIPMPYDVYHAELIENTSAIVDAVQKQVAAVGAEIESDIVTGEFELITDKRELREAFGEFQKAIKQRGASVNVRLGYPGGSLDDQVYVHETESGTFWCLPNEGGGSKFYNVFGLGAPLPFPSMNTMAVQINPPHQGTNNRLQGVFLKDSNGRYYIGHRGRLGGSHVGSSFEEFLSEKYNEDSWVSFGGASRCLVFGPLSSPDVLRQLAVFVGAAAEFKGIVDSSDESPSSVDETPWERLAGVWHEVTWRVLLHIDASVTHHSTVKRYGRMPRTNYGVIIDACLQDEMITKKIAKDLNTINTYFMSWKSRPTMVPEEIAIEAEKLRGSLDGKLPPVKTDESD
jgi:hypothetical protein